MRYLLRFIPLIIIFIISCENRLSPEGAISGSIYISSHPEGAEIWIDGENTGVLTDATIRNVEIGKHTIRLTKDGYADWYGTVEVKDRGQTALSAGLSQYKGALYVKSLPTGAEIYLDSVDTHDTTDYLFSDLEIGKHTITLVKKNYLRYYKEIEIKGNDTARISVELIPIGKIEVISEPSGAEIWIDGVQTSDTTPGIVDSIPEGFHSIKLTKENYTEWEGTVEVEQGKTKTIYGVLGAIWSSEVVGGGTSYCDIKDIKIGDGRNDGMNRIYVANTDGHIYEFTYSGTYWQKVVVGEGGSMNAVDVGYGRGDNIKRVYSASSDGHIYEFTYTDTGWVQGSVVNNTIPATAVSAKGEIVVGYANGDFVWVWGGGGGWSENYGYPINKIIDIGDNDYFTIIGSKIALIENGEPPPWVWTTLPDEALDIVNNTYEIVYAACRDHNIYECNDYGEAITIGKTDDIVLGVARGDARNDSINRIYAVSKDGNVYEFTQFNGEWFKHKVGSVYNPYTRAGAIAVGDGRNDGIKRIYVSSKSYLKEFTCESTKK